MDYLCDNASLIEQLTYILSMLDVDSKDQPLLVVLSILDDLVNDGGILESGPARRG